MSYLYSEDDCVIVSRGCVLPDATNPEEFWNNIKKNHVSIKPLPEARWDKKNNFSPYRELEDKTYSHWGAEISEDIYDFIKKKLNLKNSSRLEIMVQGAFKQAFENLKLPCDLKKVGIILGAMNPDENYYKIRFKHLLEDIIKKLKTLYNEEEFKMVDPFLKMHCELFFKDTNKNIDDILPTSILFKLKQQYRILGSSFIVDAACASGIASFDCAISLLKTNELEMVFVGGMESNLGQGSFVLFSKVGALTVENCIPFDQDSDGLSQGEGAVVFGIQKYSEAIRLGNKIYGVVRAIGSSSDGRSASLFQPNPSGQLLAEERAYQNLDSRRVDYLELHGTGTKIGDQTEAESTEVFFKGFNIPVGSVKSLVGHTKATAGATGILKCLMAIENKVLPSSDYIQKSIFSTESGIYLNKKEIKISPDSENVRFGISSFGFGGTNFHLVLENFLENKTGSQVLSKKSSGQVFNIPVLLGSHTIPFSDFDPSWFNGKDVFYKIPPKSIRYIDKAQLIAVRATEMLLNKNLNIKFTDEQNDQVQVISASSLGLDVLDHLITRISLDTVIESIKNEDQNFNLPKNILDIKQTFIPVTEESGPGVLNNVIAGRVCNAFNFRGRNFNIDCDQASTAAALHLINSDIRLGLCEFVVLIGVDETIDKENFRVIRNSVTAYAICSQKFAQNNFLKIQAEIKG